MQIWLIIDGVKQGPFTLREILEQIDASALPSTTYAWHEGMKEWMPIGEMDRFRHEYETRKEHEEEVEHESKQPTAMPVQLRDVSSAMLWRRWAARIFDFSIWYSLCLGVTAAWNFPIKEWFEAGVFLFYVMPFWIPVEAFLLHYFWRTPGKALLNLQVTNADGSPITISRGIIRSLRTFLMGMGASFPPMMFLCHCFGWWFTRKNGVAIWDVPTGVEVSAKPLHWWRWVALAFVWFISSNLLAAPAAPIMLSILKEKMPNHPFVKFMDQK